MGDFDAVDTDHDGQVTEAVVFAKAGSHVTAHLVISALDTDHDHPISRAEAVGPPAVKKPTT